MRLVDLSHVISAGMVTYPGLPGPVLGEHLGFEASHAVYAAGTEFAIGRVEMVTNTGTYLDTPAHRYRDGHDLSGLPLERCAMLPAVVVGGPATGPVGPEVLEDLAGELTVDLAGTAVLVRTGWDVHFGAERYGDHAHPHLATATAQALVDAGVALVGIDSVNIDPTDGGERPVHSLLLAAGIPVVEHLTGLDALPARGALFTAVPPRVDGLATFPVRAFAAVPDGDGEGHEGSVSAGSAT